MKTDSEFLTFGTLQIYIYTTLSSAGPVWMWIIWSWRTLWRCCYRWCWPAPVAPPPSPPPSPPRLVWKKENLGFSRSYLEAKSFWKHDWTPAWMAASKGNECWRDVTGLVPVLQAVPRLPLLLGGKRCFDVFRAGVSVFHAAPRSVCTQTGRSLGYNQSQGADKVATVAAAAAYRFLSSVSQRGSTSWLQCWPPSLES